MVYYKRFIPKTFVEATQEVLKQKPDGIIVVPSTLEQTRNFTDKLHERQVPFILLDSYMPDLKPLSFFGQDSMQSGYFAARMLMMMAPQEKEIMLMKQMRNGNVASKQQENRETGFRHYMRDHFPEVNIAELDLPLDEQKEQYDYLLERFFKKHPLVHHCITFNSKAHIVGEFLQRTNMRNIQIMGYDMVDKNAECLRQGSISFLIAQHAYMQGYECVETLFDAIVLKREVNPVNYMPIELLTKENIDFYRRKNIG
jgi:LacI family transcriptional regulator